MTGSRASRIEKCFTEMNFIVLNMTLSHSSFVLALRWKQLGDSKFYLLDHFSKISVFTFPFQRTL